MECRLCCNEFHWCLNNVAKGIARDELSYAMEMQNHYVRDMLIHMLEWYVGVNYDFKVSFVYDEQEEKGIEDYMILVKGDMLKYQ